MKKILFALFVLCYGASIESQNSVEVFQNLQQQKERGFQYFYIEALRAKLWGKMDEAFNNFQQCLQFDQDNALIYFELANMYFNVGQNKEGYEMLRKAVALNPENKWYNMYLANLYLANNQTTDAIISFEKLYKEDPSNKVYLYRLAMLYTEAEEYDKAIEMYEQLAVLTGESEMLKMELFRLNSLAGRQDVNIDACKKEIKEHPNNPVNYIRLGDSYLELRDAKKAIKSYDKALRVDPDYGEVYLSYANYYQALGDTAKMINSIQTAFENPSVELEMKKHVFIQYLIRAEKDSVLNSYAHQFYTTLDSVDNYDAELPYYYGNYLISQQDTTGYEYFEKSLQIDPEQRDVWLQLLGYQLSGGNYDHVLEICNDALLVFPEVPEFYFYKGIIVSENNNYPEAVSIIKTGLNYAGNNRDLVIRMLTSIGDLFYQMENMDSAFRYYEEVLGIDPNNIMVLNNYAYFLSISDKDLDRAEQMSAKCIELDPGNATYLDTYAWILYHKGESFLAKFYIEKAINSGGDSNPEVLEHYGYILVKNDDIQEAIVQWKKAISLEWKVEELTQKIKELKQQ